MIAGWSVHTSESGMVSLVYNLREGDESETDGVWCDELVYRGVSDGHVTLGGDAWDDLRAWVENPPPVASTELEAIERVRQLHGRRLAPVDGLLTEHQFCAECRQTWPCATIKALDA